MKQSDFVTLSFSILIHADKAKVWQVLWAKDSFPVWANWLDEGMILLGELQRGSIVEFVNARNGYSVRDLVAECVEETYVQFHHLIDLQDFGSQEREREWESGSESYRLEKVEDHTRLEVVSQVPLELETMMQERFPQALREVKRLAEQMENDGSEAMRI
ncbi:MAG: hypothetical protein ACRDBX_08290 [Erysipelotrichaceae bacterium]